MRSPSIILFFGILWYSTSLERTIILLVLRRLRQQFGTQITVTEMRF